MPSVIVFIYSGINILKKITGGILKFMKKTYFKKTLSIILLVAILLVALSSTVSARYQNIAILYAGLTIDSNGLAYCEGMVKPSDSTTNTTLTVELQKKSGNSWGFVDSWSGSGTGTALLSKFGQRYVVRGTYRVVVTAKVYSSSGTLLENENIISREVTY